MEIKKIACCHGKYHVYVNDNYYCMKPPDVICEQALKDVGKFTQGKKKILYCVHHQNPCKDCGSQCPSAKEVD